ncbi:branched-chain amino acid ABC transporter permease [Candidatus Bathyarchaeota archaeon]|jgi:branched-chain amino acid transport system permease protein|nr:MAG: branched-chain amino acid ABC transporter permease [Candidatus Bathyarchaeota archaeon]
MVAAELIVRDLAFGLMLGCVFSVVAHGLNIIWGVVKVVNIAHGEFIMLGAYGAYFLNLFAGITPLVAAPIDAAIGLLVGYIFYYTFLHRELRNKETITLQSEMVTLAATFGLSLFISNLAVILFTGNPVGVNYNPGALRFGYLTIPLAALYVAVLSVLIIAGTWLFLERTFIGSTIRAYAQDVTATELVGANPAKIASLATALGFAVTMAGGALLTVWIPVGINPLMGALYAPISFVIVVLGGPGKMWGSLVGGLTLGVVIDLAQAFTTPQIAYAAAFLILIPVLVFRPQGLLK